MWTFIPAKNEYIMRRSLYNIGTFIYLLEAIMSPIFILNDFLKK